MEQPEQEASKVGNGHRKLLSINQDVDEILEGNVNGIYNLANDFRELTSSEIITTLYELAFERGVSEAALNLGGFLEEARDFKGAKKWYKLAFLQGDPRAAVMRGYLLEDEGKLESALKWYRLGSAVHDSAIHHARVANQLGYGVEAKRALENHLETSPEAAVEYVELFGTNFVDGGLSILEDYWKQGEVLVGVPLANLYSKLGKRQEEEAVLRRAVSLGDGNAAFNLALNFAHDDEYTEALIWMKKAEKLGDSHASSWIMDQEKRSEEK